MLFLHLLGWVASKPARSGKGLIDGKYLQRHPYGRPGDPAQRLGGKRHRDAWDATANTLTYDFTVRGLFYGQVTGMHFHSSTAGMAGAVAFQAGGVAFGQLNPPQDTDDFKTTMNPDGSWTVHGVWEMSDLAASIPITNFAHDLSSATPPPAGSSTAGSPVPLYWDVHTISFPNGEIRGQLVPTA